MQILVIKPSSFGDIVHALQVAETIRRGLPGARISWVAATPFVSIARACDTVEDVVEFPRRAGLPGFLRCLREIRTHRFDFVLDMQGLARSALMTRLSRGQVKIGRRDAREGARLFCPRVVPPPPKGRDAHAVDVLLQFATVFGLPPVLAGELSFSKAPPLPTAEILPRGDGPVVAVFPESRNPAKNWPGFVEFTRILLRERADVRIVWSARGPDSTIRPPVSERLVDVTTRLSLEQLPALLGRVHWTVSNDSGPLHLASALGVPTLALFGPTDPARSGAYPGNGNLSRVLRAPGGDLRAIDPAEVLQTLFEAGLLPRTRSTGPALGD